MGLPRVRRGERHPNAVLQEPEKRAEIDRLDALGWSYRQIATSVEVSPATVRRYLLGLTGYGRSD